MPLLLSLALASAASAAPGATPSVVNHAITEADVIAAQDAWCDALVNISATYEKQGSAAARAAAERVIDAAYGYDLGPVLFKPTLTVAPQTFRTTKAGALSYFVGGDPNYPQDKGFALKGWTRCEVDNAAILLDGDQATTMGNVRMTNKDGVTVVDKTWSYVKDDRGALRIVVHHSSLPYTGK